MEETTQANMPVVSSSPHIKSPDTTGGIMRDVAFALLPALVCGIIYFGLRALYVTAISVVCCIGFEYLYQRLCKKPVTVSDGTALVTGLLLAFNLPSTAPWWMVVIGAFVAIIVAKQLFGGTGCNFMNPALAGRAYLLASWPVLMTRWVVPFTSAFFVAPDLVSSATPLAIMKGTAEGQLPSLLATFLGATGGCIGETSAAALLIGAAFLFFRRIIKPYIPFAFIGSLAILSFLFPAAGMDRLTFAAYSVLSGGVVLGAFFMATDYTTSPITGRGQLIMGLGCGIITFVIRRFGGYPEGVSYSILLMNVVTPLIDKFIKPKKYGAVRRVRHAQQ